MEEKITLNKGLVQELLGAMAAMSMTQGGNKYIDSLIEKVEKEMEGQDNE